MTPTAAGLGDVVVTGAAALVLGPGDAACDPIPFLKVRKSRKFMGIQDDLAVVAAGRALAQAGLGASLGERTGLYAAIGFIPFDQAEIDRVVAASIDERGAFSMQKFAGEGIARAHPLLTFRCLPNMPAYHVSVNFDVQGPYLVTYPGPGQLHQAIEEASFALARGEIDVALVVAVAHQRNFLVTHHFARIDHPVAAERLRDAGTCLVLETAAHARARGAVARARPVSWSLGYRPPQEDGAPHPSQRIEESFSLGDRPLDLEALDALAALGPTSLGVMLARSLGQTGQLRHVLQARDGVHAQSEWELLP